MYFYNWGTWKKKEQIEGTKEVGEHEPRKKKKVKEKKELPSNEIEELRHSIAASGLARARRTNHHLTEYHCSSFPIFLRKTQN